MPRWLFGLLSGIDHDQCDDVPECSAWWGMRLPVVSILLEGSLSFTCPAKS
ncbi:hypothetical protein ACFLSG_02445 [Candidatus Bipolaricaulota bacterium]